jgi:hypothetical protein
MAILALKAHHLTVVFNMLFQVYEGKLVQATTEALEVVARTFTRFHVPFQLSCGVDIYILLVLLTFMTHFDPIYYLPQNV